MAKISDNAIAEYARRAGFAGPNVAVAVAVAIAESGGDPTQVNPNDTGGTQSYGLWQINSVHSSLLASGDWRDPATNARMANTVWQKQGWKAWGVVNNGRYLFYMGRGAAAAAVTEGTEQAGNVVDAVNPFDDVTGLLTFVADKNNWKRLAMIVGGSVLLLIVGWALVSNTSVTGAAVNAGKTVKEVIV